MPLEATSENPPKQSGELKPYGLARLLRTAWKWYQSRKSSVRRFVRTSLDRWRTAHSLLFALCGSLLLDPPLSIHAIGCGPQAGG
jgi:hypothetical protein